MKPRIVIWMEGGLIQDISSDQPVDVLVMDYDTEGADRDRVWTGIVPWNFEKEAPAPEADKQDCWMNLWDLEGAEQPLVEHFFKQREGKCQECAGKGKLQCPDCWAENLDKEPCYECDSTGERECPECDGTGVAYEDQPNAG